MENSDYNLELSSFDSWDKVSALATPLFTNKKKVTVKITIFFPTELSITGGETQNYMQIQFDSV
jgi:hypothetical protein